VKRISLTQLICVLVAAITCAIFGQTVHYGFVNYDDHTYVYDNPVVASGFTVRGVAWAFTHAHAANWHPLTTLSHMADCQVHGLRAGGHHLTNVLLHGFAVVLLFLVLQEMTNAVWRSAFVAAVFAVHPLHVESVAWISERKDVLSAVFFMLTLAAYVYYVRKQTLGRYVTMLVLFACGLMSKPMLVTVPFVLLLLDYWPLGRIQRSEVRSQKSEVRSPWSVVSGLTFEKVPLLVLSAGSCIATLLAQTRAVNSFEELPFGWRISNALVTYTTYIGQMFWPVRLAPFYLHPRDRLSFWEVLLASGLLLAITTLAFVLRRRHPYFITGWLWYLLMLVPVIGVIQVGDQGHADRYTYLPQIGLCFAFTWGITDLAARWRYSRQQILAAFAVIIVAVLSYLAWIQTSYWRDSESLWKHAIAVTEGNDIAHANLGLYYVQSGRADDAISEYHEALNAIGQKPTRRARVAAARIHNNLGLLFAQRGRVDGAISQYQEALDLIGNKPAGWASASAALAHSNLGNALVEKGRLDEAITNHRKAVELSPDYAEGHYNLAGALLRQHEITEAISEFERALQLAPASVATMNNLAWVLTACPVSSLRNGRRAVDIAERATAFSKRKNPVVIRTLAAAYAETGRFDKAILAAEGALDLARAQNEPTLAGKLQMDIDLYRTDAPKRDPSLTTNKR
jgi:tetratricopeptide (TPR) repeat protein